MPDKHQQRYQIKQRINGWQYGSSLQVRMGKTTVKPTSSIESLRERTSCTWALLRMKLRIHQQ
jgi:hypothetical protein